MSLSLQNMTGLRTLLRAMSVSAAQRTHQQQHQQRCLSNLVRPLASACTSGSYLSPSRPVPSTRSSASTSTTPSVVRHHSTLPVQQYYVPRTYPFPVILTTEIIAEDDVELHRANPHDLPPYKSTLTCNIHDLPLTAAEKRVFRLLVGSRMYSHTFHAHPVPSFLTAKNSPHIPRHHRQRAKDSPVRVRFVSRHLTSPIANENRVFQLLDESIRTSKVLVAEMGRDGQWVEEGEDEAVLRELRERYRVEKREGRLKRKAEDEEGGGGVVEGEQVQTIGGESVGRATERQRVPVASEIGGQTFDGEKRQ